jgi:hypothetical protein
MRKLQITDIGDPADVLELVEFQAPATRPGPSARRGPGRHHQHLGFPSTSGASVTVVSPNLRAVAVMGQSLMDRRAGASGSTPRGSGKAVPCAEITLNKLRPRCFRSERQFHPGRFTARVWLL